MDAKFNFYEVVSIIRAESVPKKLWNQRGVIVGRSQADSGLWEYGVMVFADNNNSWQLEERFLKATGEQMKREQLYTGETVKVSVDPRTGKGELENEE